jgi:iron(III) transport system substrate-binding protein
MNGRKLRSRLATIAVCVVAVTGLVGSSANAASTGGAPTEKQLYKAAQKDGSLTVYSSMQISSNDGLLAAWNQRYPEVGLTITRLSPTADLGTRVTAERNSARPADVFIVNDQSLATTRMAETPPGIRKINVPTVNALPQSAVYFDGRLVTIKYDVQGMAWNSATLPKGVKSLKALLDPSLKGKIGLPVPVIAGIDFYRYLTEVGGPNYLKDLAAQQPIFYPSTQAITQAIVSGEIVATPFAGLAAVNPLKQAGAPLGFQLPKVAWSNATFAGILNEAKHPDAARLFMNFLLTAPAQKAISVGGVPIIDKRFPASVGTREGVRPYPGAFPAEQNLALQAQVNAIFGR